MKGRAFRRAETRIIKFCHPERSMSADKRECGVEGPAVMGDRSYCVYMIASKSRVLYIGMTNNLERRVFEHKNNLIEGFTSEYRCHRLVYYESYDDVLNAIEREKQLKRWNRKKKVWLIERSNPTWEDLAAEWYTAIDISPMKKQVPRLALLRFAQSGGARDDNLWVRSQ